MHKPTTTNAGKPPDRDNNPPRPIIAIPTRRFVKLLTRHGSDAVLYIPRELQQKGWRAGIHITLKENHDTKEITLEILTATAATAPHRPGPYVTDRRATSAPEN